jgi:hypothetical protein
LQIDNIQHNSALEAAIAWLIGQRVIREPLDVRRKLEESSGNFSSYYNGKLTPSKRFSLKFKEAYNVDLADFEDGKWPEDGKPGYSPGSLKDKEEIIRLLKEKEQLQINLSALIGKIANIEKTVSENKRLLSSLVAEYDIEGDQQREGGTVRGHQKSAKKGTKKNGS